MKKRSPILVAMFIFMAAHSFAQDGFSTLFKSGPADATKLMNAYAEPLFKGFGVGLNSGWTNTAETKKLFHFDFRFTGSVAFVPDGDKAFDVTKIGLSNNIKPAVASETLSPTVSGRGIPPQLNIFDDNGKQVAQFNMPAGKIAAIPSPQIQLTVGLLQNTDFTVRAMPSINLGHDVGSVSMIGFGIKHDIMQDIAGNTADDILPFDLAVAFGYSHLTLNTPLTVSPDGAVPENNQQNTDFSNQHVNGKFDSFLLQAIISKKFLAFTPFFALGYNNSHTSAATIGNFPITTGSTSTGQQTYTTYVNPINISETSINGLRADLGFQVEAGFFRIYASGSLAQYKSVNAGIGFGF